MDFLVYWTVVNHCSYRIYNDKTGWYNYIHECTCSRVCIEDALMHTNHRDAQSSVCMYKCVHACACVCIGWGGGGGVYKCIFLYFYIITCVMLCYFLLHPRDKIKCKNCVRINEKIKPK